MLFSPSAGCPVTMLRVCTLFRVRRPSRPCFFYPPPGSLAAIMKLPRAGSSPVQDALLARRSFLTLAAIAVASPTAPALASIANLRDEQFGFTLSYPDDWVPAPKPVKTHLSESLLQSPIRGVSLGVTVDPVKINSLAQFGTAEQASQDSAAHNPCLLYTSPSPRDVEESRMPSSA